MAEKPIGELAMDVIERHDAYPTLTLWFDGACEPVNPGGVATCGWLVRDCEGKLVANGYREVCRGPKATNNVAEYSALGFGLRWIADNYPDGNKCRLFLRGDSKLVVEQIHFRWNCNKEHLQKLRDRCLKLIMRIAPVSWEATWIPREENEQADALSRMAYEESTGKRFPERTRR